MQKLLMFVLLVIVVSCVRKVDPTVENINTIFASKDFTFEFVKSDGTRESVSFRQDYLVYKSDKPIFRREITYDEVLLINNFIQKTLKLHSDKLDPKTTSHYVIKNTAYKVIIVPDQEDYYFEALTRTLQLP